MSINKKWFYHWHHDVIFAAFVVGLATFVIGQVQADRASGALGAAVLVPLFLAVVKRVSMFFSSPPSTTSDALSQGQARGFARSGLIGMLAVVAIIGIVLLPGIVRQPAPCPDEVIQVQVDQASAGAAAHASDEALSYGIDHRDLKPANENGLTCGMSLAGQGCSWWQSNSPTVVSDFGQIGSCVLSKLFASVLDPLAIAAACLPATVSDVEQIIASLIQFYDTPTVVDAGASDDSGSASDAAPSVGASSVPALCGSKPLPKGLESAPRCLSLYQLGRLHVLHAQAASMLDAGAR